MMIPAAHATWRREKFCASLGWIRCRDIARQKRTNDCKSSLMPYIASTRRASGPRKTRRKGSGEIDVEDLLTKTTMVSMVTMIHLSRRHHQHLRLHPEEDHGVANENQRDHADTGDRPRNRDDTDRTIWIEVEWSAWVPNYCKVNRNGCGTLSVSPQRERERITIRIIILRRASASSIRIQHIAEDIVGSEQSRGFCECQRRLGALLLFVIK
mmetsp:Transcript_7544/g.20415  ORF Transcript_7544/g.20415 Transcript_7544/m.20415 type:complete len:212 (-) Transcript_7544:638-1273(-)